MDEEFIRNRITELRLKKGVSEYQMSMELGQNRSYIQAISSGRSMPSMKQFLNICEYFEITPLQFFDAQENNPQLTVEQVIEGTGVAFHNGRSAVNDFLHLLPFFRGDDCFMAILDNFPVLTRDNVIGVGANPFLMCPADQMCALIKRVSQDMADSCTSP